MLSAVLIGAVALLPSLAAHAREELSVSDLKDRLNVIQKKLDSSVARVEALRSRENELLFEVDLAELDIRDLEAMKRELEARVVAAARRLYMAGDSGTLEILLSAESFADLATKYEAMERVGDLDTAAFTDLKGAEERLRDLQADLTAKTEELTRTRARLEDESALLQARFEDATAQYKKRKEELAAAAQGVGVFITVNGMTCPVAAPNSFIDSWGFPRSGGRTHEGTDIMAAFGAPVVAITDGRITYVGYGTLSGNWIILSGDDDHTYMYMHNRKNLVSEGVRVRAGEQIATVGDTGNAAGTPPHVHFEYHPEGGGPVNPYPMLAKVCRTAP